MYLVVRAVLTVRSAKAVNLSAVIFTAVGGARG